MMYLYKWKESLTLLDKEGFLVNDKEVWWNYFQRGVFCGEVHLIHRAIDEISNPKKNFIDIGAHVGSWSWLLAPYFNMTYSFEPNKKIYNYLCGNIALRDISDKIDTFNLGLSDEEKTLDFHNRVEDGGGNGFEPLKTTQPSSVVPLQVKPLDDFNFKNVGFIKIDVEGHEKKVLEGAQNTIFNNDHPPILFESWKEGKHSPLHPGYANELREELFTYVKELGYNKIECWGFSEIFLATKQ